MRVRVAIDANQDLGSHQRVLDSQDVPFKNFNRTMNDHTRNSASIDLHFVGPTYATPYRVVVLLFASLIICPHSAARADTFGSSDQLEIDFVLVGDPGNANDRTGYPATVGKVEYKYRISKYEISEAMIDLANVEGGLGLTHDNRGPNQPATSISWLEAATFINWLNTSQGHQAAYNFDGTGNFQLWSSAEAWQDGGENRFRHKDTVYFLPSMDEWYKAAYYDPTNGVYYDYPTGSNIVPSAVADGTAANTAVYNQSFDDVPADITQAGGLSPYGTMGQGGNVAEWEETEFDFSNNTPSLGRGIRGGNWFSGIDDLMSSDRRTIAPTSELLNTGFRVASTIPEPNSVLLTALVSFGLAMRRRRSC